jgi:hypothetical protein
MYFYELPLQDGEPTGLRIESLPTIEYIYAGM